MGCAVCSHLLDLWAVKVSRTGRGAMELSSCPRMLQGGYHRVTGLHYTSSFSDAEDCCDDTSSGDSCTSDWPAERTEGCSPGRQQGGPEPELMPVRNTCTGQ